METEKIVVGKNPKMQKIFALVEKIAPTDSNVLLIGETGTGKSLIAEIIHSRSRHRYKPMVHINCGAIPVTLQESELFGHAKGSFTGADSSKIGLIESAHESTIFLDEICEMSNTMQVSLLHFIESGKIRTVGEIDETCVDARIISATNCDIEEAIRQKKLREDLYYRLNVLAIQVPPLRDRREDIISLANYFLSRSSMKLDRSVPSIPESIAELLIEHRWTGNVRELKNAMECAALLTENGKITKADLPKSVTQMSRLEASRESNDQIFAVNSELPLSQVEKEYILYQLDQCDWNKSLAAERLQIGRNTLWRKLKSYGEIAE